MTRAALSLVALIALADVAAPDALTGFASAYAPGRMEEVIATRFDNDWWPSPPAYDWYTAHGAIAVMDCGRVGEMATVTVSGREYRVLIADCAGADGPADRFSRDNIIMELNWQLWQQLTAEHGKPLEVQLR